LIAFRQCHTPDDERQGLYNYNLPGIGALCLGRRSCFLTKRYVNLLSIMSTRNNKLSACVYVCVGFSNALSNNKTRKTPFRYRRHFHVVNCWKFSTWNETCAIHAKGYSQVFLFRFFPHRWNKTLGLAGNSIYVTLDFHLRWACQQYRCILAINRNQVIGSSEIAITLVHELYLVPKPVV
jgi:hypothetical protein